MIRRHLHNLLKNNQNFHFKLISFFFFSITTYLGFKSAYTRLKSNHTRQRAFVCHVREITPTKQRR